MKPPTATTFKLRAFAEWIEAQGGFIQSTKNEWEVLRYLLNGKTPRILYRNKAGKLTISDEIADDYKLFQTQIGKAGPDAVEKIKRQNTASLRKDVIARDFPDQNITCCYCGQFVDESEVTFEHFLPVKKGGPNHIHNGALSCKPCNLAVGSHDVYQKILLRDVIRDCVSETRPWLIFSATKNAALEDGAA